MRSTGSSPIISAATAAQRNVCVSVCVCVCERTLSDKETQTPANKRRTSSHPVLFATRYFFIQARKRKDERTFHLGVQILSLITARALRRTLEPQTTDQSGK
ncbi:unnamed protein product [Boreogadus saida]